MSHNKILFINLYLFFIVSGIIDLLIFYNGYTIIPEGLQSFILSGCFSVEFLVYFTIIEDDTRHSLIFLLATSTVLSLTSLLETVVENRLIKFCRSYFTTLQGTWLLQLSSMSAASASLNTWVTIIFIWHAGSLFLFLLLVSVTSQHCCTRGTRGQMTRASYVETEAGSQLVQCKMMKLSPDRRTLTHGIDMSPSTPSASVVDMEPWDNVKFHMEN